MKKRKKERLKYETVFVLLVIVMVLGVVLGYAWRMSQVEDTGKAIIEAVTGCNQLITDELVISPTKDCGRLGTAIVGLKRGIFDYREDK